MLRRGGSRTTWLVRLLVSLMILMAVVNIAFISKHGILVSPAKGIDGPDSKATEPTRTRRRTTTGISDTRESSRMEETMQVEQDTGNVRSPALRGAVRKTQDAKEIHVFYYAWYGSPEFNGVWRHWNHELIPHWNAAIAEKYQTGQHVPPEDIGSSFYPSRGPYSSSDPKIIQEHFQSIAAHGMQTVVLSWYPPGLADSSGTAELADSLVSKLLDVALEAGLKVALHIEPYNGRTAESVFRDAEYIDRNYGEHPALCKRHVGSSNTPVPLLYIYDSYLISTREWMRAFAKRPSNGGGFMIGLLVNHAHMSELADAGFDGMYTYFAATRFTWGSTLENWTKIARFCSEKDKLFIPSIGPGYDDVAVRPWNDQNTRARNGGKYYKDMFQNAVKARDIQENHGINSVLSITSYNEWHEGTQIEEAIPFQTETNQLDVPGRKYKDYSPLSSTGYLELTLEFSQQYLVDKA